MEVVEESAERLSLRHRPGASSRIAVYIRLFMALSFLVGPVLVIALTLTAPATRIIECDRARATCRINGRWGHSGWTSFTMRQLDVLVVHPVSEHRYVLAAMMGGKPQFWSNDISDPAAVTALEHAVAELHGFSSGSAPTVHVEFPRGQISPGIFPLGFCFVAGVLMLVWAQRTIWRLTVVADRSEGVVRISRRPVLGATRSVSVPVSTVRAVLTLNTALRAGGGLPIQYVAVALQTSESPEVPVLREYRSPYGMAAGRDLAARLAAFLGVPAQGS